MRVRVPADVDMADRIFAGLTARQLAILGAHGLLLLALYAALGERIPLPLLGAVAVPICLLGLLWATTSPEGTTWEQMALAALRHFSRPRRRVLAPEGIPEPPAWAGGIGALAPVEFPAQDASADGHVDLGDEGAVAICRASSVNFALRSETEQRALIEGFARTLNALDEPLLFLVRSNRADVRGLIEAIEERAPGLPHLALEAAAREHAGFLRSLAARRDVLSREVLLCFREPGPAGGEEAASGLAHRVEEMAALLRGLGVRLVRLEGDEATELLSRAADPETEPARPGIGPWAGFVEGSW
ncbi:MAG TPA: PrgI family protein [Actinomycetota bacterium]|nr:PrgI family protein [Actinomycetota bacterium]